jgi:mRNA-degrading endonuclease RelE of RelBE toxin-antitoxin system
MEGFHRLRVGSYRIVFWYVSSKSGMTVDCVFAERRSVIYLVLEQVLRKGLLKPDKGA